MSNEVDIVNQIIEIINKQIGMLFLGWFSVVIGLIIKDILTSIIFGIMFYLDQQFKEGDIIFIDGEEAIIQKIGLTITVFKIRETSRWRYVKNDKIRYLKLEKKVE